MQHKNVNCYIVFILVDILHCWRQLVSTKLCLFAAVHFNCGNRKMVVYGIETSDPEIFPSSKALHFN